MFFKNLFKKDELLLRVEVVISDISTFTIKETSHKTNDKLFVLLGLLIYARILRVEPLQAEKDSIMSLFSDFASNHKSSVNKEESLKMFMNLFDLMKDGHNYITIKEFKTKIKLKKNKRDVFYLYMGNVLVEPMSKIVYTTFMYIIKNIKKENQIHLIEAFETLSKIYQTEKFSSIDAVIIPNVIVNEITDFDGSL